MTTITRARMSEQERLELIAKLHNAVFEHGNFENWDFCRQWMQQHASIELSESAVRRLVQGATVVYSTNMNDYVLTATDNATVEQLLKGIVKRLERLEERLDPTNGQTC